MKISDIEVGERYEVAVGWMSSRKSGIPMTGRYEGEVTQVRVHREVRRDGWFQQSKNPDGVEVEILMDGEAFPDNIIAVHPKEIIRPWEEKLAEDRRRDEAERKKDRKRQIERWRGRQYNEKLVEILGPMPEGGPLDRRVDRVKIDIRDYGPEPSSGTVWVASVDELARMVDLMEKGLEHEKVCS